jgi:hypothetical protein
MAKSKEKEKESVEVTYSRSERVMGMMAFVLLVVPVYMAGQIAWHLGIIVWKAMVMVAMKTGHMIASFWEMMRSKDLKPAQDADTSPDKDAVPPSKADADSAAQPKEQSDEKPMIVREERDNVIVLSTNRNVRFCST